MGNLYTVDGTRLFGTTGKIKVYDSGVMITLGDSYTVYMNTFFDTFATKHGLVQKNVGLASSKIARPEGEGQDTIKSFVTRLDELIASFPITINDTTYEISDVKLITFMGGANDWTTIDEAQGIDRIGDKTSTDKEQLYGACKYIFGRLQETFPNADIVCILQPNNANNSDPYVMWMKESIVKDCSEMYQIPICDCCFNFPSPFNPIELAKYWKDDKLHLTDDGHQLVIDKLEQIVNSL